MLSRLFEVFFIVSFEGLFNEPVSAEKIIRFEKTGGKKKKRSLISRILLIHGKRQSGRRRKRMSSGKISLRKNLM